MLIPGETTLFMLKRRVSPDPFPEKANFIFYRNKIVPNDSPRESLFFKKRLNRLNQQFL